MLTETRVLDSSGDGVRGGYTSPDLVLGIKLGSSRREYLVTEPCLQPCPVIF